DQRGKKRMINLLNLSILEFKDQLKTLGIKPFVAVQVFDWIFKKHKGNFDDMPNISKDIRKKLKEAFVIRSFSKVDVMHSEKGNASKFVLTLHDGLQVECVALKEKKYWTLCISSQVGCPIDCKFCLTGVMGFKRQLAAHEIVEQVLTVMQSGLEISRLVFMGMGEPLLNYDAVFTAIDQLNSEDTYYLSKRKMTVSTSGLMQGIKRLITDERYINLAFSVGSTDLLIREKIMPLEKRNPFVEVVRLLHEYQKMHNRKLTLEYTVLKGQNDSTLAISGLINLSKYLNAKVNLINLNPHEKIPFSPVSKKDLEEIKKVILAAKVPVTIRYEKGQDITAACGQLGESGISELGVKKGVSVDGK
ncbi:MAG: 23S rRNA (adenine2503-C2)-methyltransferase, partial [Candidatus Marinamargulisbacteria bacterium]